MKFLVLLIFFTELSSADFTSNFTTNQPCFDCSYTTIIPSGNGTTDFSTCQKDELFITSVFVDFKVQIWSNIFQQNVIIVSVTIVLGIYLSSKIFKFLAFQAGP